MVGKNVNSKYRVRGKSMSINVYKFPLTDLAHSHLTNSCVWVGEPLYEVESKKLQKIGV